MRPTKSKSSLGALIDDTKQYPLLTAEREAELSAIILDKTSPEAVKRATDELVNSNIRLVIYYVKYRTRTPPSEVEELVAAGMPGLVRAASDYDSSRGRFSTYAMWWIKQSISRDLSDCNPHYPFRIPVYLQSGRRLTEKAKQRKAVLNTKCRSFNSDTDERECADGDPFHDEDAAPIYQLLDYTSRRERDAIERYYGLNGQDPRKTPSLKTVGEELGLTRQRVEQIIKSGLTKMRQQAKAAGCS